MVPDGVRLRSETSTGGFHFLFMGLSPLGERDEGLGHGPAERRQRVLDSNRNLGVDLPFDQAVTLERAERVCHHLLRDARQASEQPSVTPDPAGHEEEEMDLPFAVEHVECGVDAVDLVEITAAWHRDLPRLRPTKNWSSDESVGGHGSPFLRWTLPH
jgi:hypothetical protein